MTTLDVKQHDLLPPLTITLTDNGMPVDLTAAESIKVIGSRSGTEVFNRPATGDDQGVIVYDWQVGDTAVSGLLEVEVEVTWAGAKPQTFPPRGYLRVNVTRDLG